MGGLWIRFSNDDLQNIKHESVAARLQPEKVARQDISDSLAPLRLPGDVSGLAKMLKKCLTLKQIQQVLYNFVLLSLFGAVPHGSVWGDFVRRAILPCLPNSKCLP